MTLKVFTVHTFETLSKPSGGVFLNFVDENTASIEKLDETRGSPNP
jgi:hypothetical protein